MFTTTPLCAICNPWVQNATGYASQSVCINSNNDFGMPSKTYDCYCQPIGPCQERVKTEGYITISALISASFSWFQLISVGIESESAGINQIGSYRLESACISTCQCELKKKKKKANPRVGEALPRVQCGCNTHFAALVLQRTKFGFHGPLNGSLPSSNPIFL